MPIMVAEDGEDLATLGTARRTVYSFLSSVFAKPPSAERLNVLRSKSFMNAALGLFTNRVLAGLDAYACAASADSAQQRAARQEFMNLFKVPGGQYVMPYESVYRDTRDVDGRPVKGLLMGQSAVDVQKWYRLAAVEVAGAYKDLPDNICLELNFMSHLCGKELDFASRGDEAKLTRAWELQRDFLAGHIVKWVRLLRDKIHEKSQHTYFRAVSALTVEFAERDLATLERVLGKSSGKSAPDYDELKP